MYYDHNIDGLLIQELLDKNNTSWQGARCPVAGTLFLLPRIRRSTASSRELDHPKRRAARTEPRPLKSRGRSPRHDHWYLGMSFVVRLILVMSNVAG